MTKKKVCIIGAGVSGLPSIKSCIEEGNLDVVCYEKTSDIGGLWNYRPNQKNIEGNVMKTTVINTSKEMMAYSDFPPPSEWPNFMHHSLVQKYLVMYAKKFDLFKYIQFNTKVTKVEFDKENQNWKVSFETKKAENYDALMLCTGHHSIPQYPVLQDLDKFEGRVIHAKDYHETTGFEEKNVLILGIGNSALDIAVDLAKIAKNVIISTRRGSWIFNRVSQLGLPYDITLISRFYKWLMRILPWTVINDFMEHRLQQRMDHDLYGLRPNHRFFQQHPTVNDALTNLIASGLITITEDIDTFNKTEVIFKNGQKFSVDVLILATGYTFAFPYLEPPSILPINNHQVDLYKYVFSLEWKNLAIIGLIQPIGSVAPISEMQSRWAASVFSERSTLPSYSIMINDIYKKRKAMNKRYFLSNKHTIQVDFVEYMDELADLVGCKPSLKKLLFQKPALAFKLFFGPNVSYIYRLTGPNSWEKAENIIWTVLDRVKFPLQNRICQKKQIKKQEYLDKYFYYVSKKWIAGYSCIILCTGIWMFCNLPNGISLTSYFIQIFIFFCIFSSMLLWFDLQYNVITIF